MYLERFGEKFINPVDFAYEDNGVRKECSLADLPNDAALFMDIGTESIALFEKEIAQAGTIFVNGPVGAYENALFEKGTKSLWNAIADAPGFSVVGGGDSVTAASRFVENPAERFGYICTAGGAMVRFLSGVELPLITALRKAYEEILMTRKFKLPYGKVERKLPCLSVATWGHSCPVRLLSRD